MKHSRQSEGRWAIVNARLLDPASQLDAPGALLIEKDIILDYGPRLFNDARPGDLPCLDLHGAALAPGLVDMRVTPAGNLSEISRSALTGGITSFACIPDDLSPCDTIDSISSIAQAKPEAAKAVPMGALTQGRAGQKLCELGLLAQAGAVAFTDGDRALADARLMERALRYASGLGVLIVQHPEEPSLAKGGVATAGTLASTLGLPAILPQAEVIMIERDLRLLESTGGRYHAGHISTAAALAALRQAKRRGLQVTCDTAPAYFCLTEQAIAGYQTAFKLSPPLRSKADNLAIIEGLADGTIDAIASDHISYNPDLKRVPFAQAACGMSCLDLLLPLALSLVRSQQLELLTALRLLTCGPADILGLTAGRLKRGGIADLVVFDSEGSQYPKNPQEAGMHQGFFHQSQPTRSWVLHTIVAGQLLFSAKEIDVS